MTAPTPHPPDSNRRPLSERHAQLISGSCIADDVAAERGYFTASRTIDLLGLGWNRSRVLSQILPGLVIPVYGALNNGAVSYAVIRPDSPRDRNGKPVKYEVPSMAGNVVDVLPRLRGTLADPSVRLWIPEGARKADSLVSQGEAAVSISGVYGWRGTGERGGRTALPDWEVVALNGRAVIVAFDSDAARKPDVAEAARRLGMFLTGKGAHVRFLVLDDDGVHKRGVDDALADGMSLADLLGCLRDAPPSLGGSDIRRVPYRETGNGIVWDRMTRDGHVEVPLTNFTAHITRDILEDDGVERRHIFEIEARQPRRTARADVPAASYGAMSWPMDLLGASAIIEPGTSTRDRVRAAVQGLSGNIPRSQRFAHTGWREVGGQLVYLHGGGGIGQEGVVDGIEVVLPSGLEPFVLPPPPEGDALQTAVRSSLALLDIAPRRITIPLFGVVWRSVLGGTDFSCHLVGPTGTRKTAVAALFQQHFGAGFHARALPGSWSSTDNALEAIAFAVKDAIFTVDDFAPNGTAVDVARLHTKAERLLRAQGNLSARQRMRHDTSLRPARPPRGLILSTGEDVPGGQSLRARVVTIDIESTDIDLDRLTSAQEAGNSGVYAAAMAGFVRWRARNGVRSRSLATTWPRYARRSRPHTVGSPRTSPTWRLASTLSPGSRLTSAPSLTTVPRTSGARLGRCSLEWQARRTPRSAPLTQRLASASFSCPPSAPVGPTLPLQTGHRRPTPRPGAGGSGSSVVETLWPRVGSPGATVSAGSMVTTFTSTPQSPIALPSRQGNLAAMHWWSGSERSVAACGNEDSCARLSPIVTG